MFTPREPVEGGHGGQAVAAGSPAYALAFARGAAAEAARRAREPMTLRVRLSHCKLAIEAHCRTADIVPDLADDIGSARWYRGLATMLGLSFVALAFWPEFSSVEAATAMPIDHAAREEFRSQMIMPLAMGGDSGRRMAATRAVTPVASVPERAMVRLTATLAQGDSFGRMLQRAGVGAGDAARAAELVAGNVPLGEIAPGTRFAITLGRRDAPGQPRPLDKLDFRARFDLDLALARRGGNLTLAQRPIAVDTTPLRIRGTIGPSLYRSARAAGAPVKAIQQYLQTIDPHLSLESDLSPADQFDIVVSYKRSANGESETGDLLYAGIERQGRHLAQLLRWGKDGQFFEASGMGKAQSTGGFSPVAGRITSGFGMRRHPILGYARLHGGVDFGAAWGTPIHAVTSGMVSYAGRHGGHGNYVRLEHGGGLGTGYAHMSRFAVSPGMRVSAGQVIGYVGSTGLSTGPHLHYEMYRGGQKVNPLSVSFATKVQVDTRELAAFKARLAQIRGIAPGKALQGPNAKPRKLAAKD